MPQHETVALGGPLGRGLVGSDGDQPAARLEHAHCRRDVVRRRGDGDPHEPIGAVNDSSCTGDQSAVEDRPATQHRDCVTYPDARERGQDRSKLAVGRRQGAPRGVAGGYGL